MSDVSASSSSSRKRRLDQLNDTIEQLTEEVNNLNDYVYKTEFECSLMTIKLKREKLIALAAVARAQVIMAEMKTLVAKKELSLDVERLKNLKNMRMDREEGASQRQTCQVQTPPAMATMSVQTSRGKSEKKKYKRHSSSRKSPVDNTSSRKSPDISLDETVLIPSIYENTQINETAESPAKKQKSANKVKPKSKPNGSHKANSVSVSKQSQRSPKTVAEVSQIAETSSKQLESSSHLICPSTSRPEDQTPTVSATWLVPQPSTSAMSQTIYSNSQKTSSIPRFNFYGCQQ